VASSTGKNRTTPSLLLLYIYTHNNNKNKKNKRKIPNKMEKPVASRTHSAGERPREIFVYIRTHAGAQLFLSATRGMNDDTHQKTKMAAKEILMTLGELTSHMVALRARAITSFRNEPIGRNFFVYKTRGWGNKNTGFFEIK
jgi:hypothetical protein